MKILHVLDHSIPLQSGYASRTRAIIDAQRARGWETVHLTSAKQGPGPEQERVAGLDFYRTPATRGRGRRLPLLDQWEVVSSLSARLKEVILAERPSIVHAHSPALTGLAVLRATERESVPVVYECRAFWEDAAVDHGTQRQGDLRYRLTRRLETHVFQRVDAVTTICEGLQRDIVARGIPADKVTVIPNAVDVERFGAEGDRDEALARRLGLAGKRVIGFIGSFYAYEGLDLLIEALGSMLDRDSAIRILLVGGGPEDRRLRDLTRARGLDSHVIFVGRVPHEEVQRYYSLVDLFVYPRRQNRLTELVTPLKPLESMAQGKVVVASDIGGHRELIRSGVNGFLFAPDDARSLAEAALNALVDEASRRAIAARARIFVEEERTWRASVARYAPVYQGLLDGRMRAAS